MTIEDPSKRGRKDDASTRIDIKIPTNVTEYIGERTQEVEKEDLDRESGELQAELLRAELEASAKFMTWVKQTQNPGQVLYVSSDVNRTPQLIFGDDHVLQVKLESPRPVATTHNEVFHLPISDQTIDLVIIEPPFQDQFKLRQDLARIAQIGAVVVVSRTLETYEDADSADPDPFSKLFPGFEMVPVPEIAQNKDPNALRWIDFYMFRKVSDTELAKPIEEPEFIPKPERVPWVEHEILDGPIPQIKDVVSAKRFKKMEEQDKEALRAVLTPEGIRNLAEVSIQRKVEKMRTTFQVGDSVRLEAQLFLQKVRDGEVQENEEVIDQSTLWNNIEEKGQAIALDQFGKFLDVDIPGIGKTIAEQVRQEGLETFSKRVATKDEMFEVEVFYEYGEVKYKLIKVKE
jgi:hypothetical protein